MHNLQFQVYISIQVAIKIFSLFITVTNKEILAYLDMIDIVSPIIDCLARFIVIQSVTAYTALWNLKLKGLSRNYNYIVCVMIFKQNIY